MYTDLVSNSVFNLIQTSNQLVPPGLEGRGQEQRQGSKNETGLRRVKDESKTCLTLPMTSLTLPMTSLTLPMTNRPVSMTQSTSVHDPIDQCWPDWLILARLVDTGQTG